MEDTVNVQLGDYVVAVGSTADFDNLVSLGIVSTILQPSTSTGTDLVLNLSATFIDISTMFSKEIRGGPLVNTVGDVVGVCTYRREDLNGLGL